MLKSYSVKFNRFVSIRWVFNKLTGTANEKRAARLLLGFGINDF